MIEKTQPLSFMEALQSSTSKIFQFKGRARRSEYWWTMLAVCILNLLLTPFLGMIINTITTLLTLGLTFRRLHDIGRSGWWWGAGVIMTQALILSLIYDVFVIIGTDFTYTDEYSLYFGIISKYYIWFIIVSIYQIVMLVFMCLDSQPFENKYGESPKYPNTDKAEQKTENS